MAFDIAKISARARNLRAEKARLQTEHQQKIKDIDDKIKKEEEIFGEVNRLLEPFICKSCHGTGEESYTDAAGSKDCRECRYCHGSGINYRD